MQKIIIINEYKYSLKNMLKDYNIKEITIEKYSDLELVLYGKPEEMAWAIIYLLSDASAWVTGTSLIIDGGVSLK